VKQPEISVLVEIGSAFQDQVDSALVERSVRTALRVGLADRASPAAVGERAEVGVHITDDEQMRRLNDTYRGVDRPTDVLSFSLLEGPELPRDPEWPTQLGDIVISYPHVERQADELGHSVPTELAWLTVRGALQILGYRHETEEEAAHMEALERAALQELGLFPGDG
jgi:probable rRNA maturation factor